MSAAKQQPTFEADQWRALSHRRRCQMVASAAGEFAAAAPQYLTLLDTPRRTDASETLSAELIPLCDALAWLGRRGHVTLRSRRVGARGRPAWLWGVRSRVDRVPRGRVLVISAWNYPIFLPGVQIAQALAAGNCVSWKPAPGYEQLASLMGECFFQAGVPRSELTILDTNPEAATETMRQGVDLVVLTGSVETGRAVMAEAARHMTPAIMELSGCDSLLVLQGADLERAADAVRFGLRLNGGATCIAPRRILVDAECADAFVQVLKRRLDNAPSAVVHPAARPRIVEVAGEALASDAVSVIGQFDANRLIHSGAMDPLVIGGVDESMRIMREDLFGPIAALCRVESVDQAIGLVNRCPYRLAASVFGPRSVAEQVAMRLDVGTVTVNDLIVPTADPRLPFGGRGQSGIGVTRGEEGLLEMTVPRVVSIRRGGSMRHLDTPQTGHSEILGGALSMRHGGTWRFRLDGLRQLIAGVRLTRSSNASTQGESLS